MGSITSEGTDHGLPDKSPQALGRADVRDNQPNLKVDRVSSRTSFNAAILCLAVNFFTPVFPAGAQTASDYPQKPLRVFVPYGPGGVGDLTMRLLADKLSQDVKQQFIIENRPGAGGIVNMTGGQRTGDQRVALRKAAVQRAHRLCSDFDHRQV